MKKLLLLAAMLTAYLLTTNASDKTWTFEAWTPTGTAIISDTTINGLTLIPRLNYINSNADSATQIGLAFGIVKTGRPPKTIDGETFTASIKTGGSSFISGLTSAAYLGTDSVFPIKRYFKFTTTDSSTIKVYFSSGHPGTARSCKISDGNTILAQATDSGDGTVVKATTSGSGTVYIYSNNNIYIYKITATNVGKNQLGITSRTAVWLADTLHSTDSVTFTTDSAWTASSNQTWLTLNKTSGIGNAAISFSASANSGLARTATLTIKGAGRAVRNIQVTQLGTTTTEWDFSHLYLANFSKASLTNGTLTKYYNANQDIVPAISYSKTVSKKMLLSLREYPNFTISYTNNTVQTVDKYIILFYDNNICATGKNVYFTFNNVQKGDTLALSISPKSATGTANLIAYSGATADANNPTVTGNLNSDGMINRYTLKFIATSSQVVLKETAGGIRIYSIKGVTTTTGKTTPDLTWNAPADISYPTPLSGTQLNASSSVAGTYAYTPSAGTILNAGNGQDLSVTFTPTDTTTYASVTKTVKINVLSNTLTGLTNVVGYDDLIVYPNPADSYFKLNGIDSNTYITVCSMDGCSLLYKQVSAGSPINISSLPLGAYFLYIDSSNGRLVRILIKK